MHFTKKFMKKETFLPRVYISEKSAAGSGNSRKELGKDFSLSNEAFDWCPLYHLDWHLRQSETKDSIVRL